MEDELSLKWKNHYSAFVQLLGTIRSQQLYADVTLICSGKVYKAHQMVLSACSDYFKEIFNHVECKKPVIVLNDVSSKDLETLLDYMYIAEANVKQCELSSLMNAAKCLKIKGLTVDDDEPSSELVISSLTNSQNSPRPKRKRKSSENMAEQAHRTKSSRRDTGETTVTNNEDPSLTVVSEESFFVKEEFVDSEPFLIEKTNPDQTLNDNFIHQDSSSQVHENLIYPERSTISERPQSQFPDIQNSAIDDHTDKSLLHKLLEEFRKLTEVNLHLVADVECIKSEIRSAQKETMGTLNALVISNVDPSGCNEHVKQFPISSKERFVLFNKNLSSSTETFNLMLSYYSGIGGEDYKAACRNCLKKTFSNQFVIESLSWSGKERLGNPKFGIQLSKIMDCISEAIQKQYNVTRQMIGITCMKWVQQAKDRNGGRMRKTKENIQFDNSQDSTVADLAKYKC